MIGKHPAPWRGPAGSACYAAKEQRRNCVAVYGAQARNAASIG